MSADSKNVWEDGVGHRLNAIRSSLQKASGERVHLDAMRAYAEVVLFILSSAINAFT